MATGGIDTLFHFSFAVNDLDKARRFYGGLLGCPEGRKLPGRVDFNFFGHH
ncbi:MAG: VOC family protein, partial [Burkholderiales bacterium]